MHEGEWRDLASSGIRSWEVLTTSLTGAALRIMRSGIPTVVVLVGGHEREREARGVGSLLEVGRFLKIRNCELGFLLPLSQIRNCESENDSFFDSFPIPLDYDSGSNSIKITKNGQ